MVTVLRFHGVDIKVNQNDHNPPHCHVKGGDRKARFNLKTMEWMEHRGFSRRDLAALREVIERRYDELMAKWEEYHGKE